MLAVQPHDLSSIVGITSQYNEHAIHRMTTLVLENKKVPFDLAENALFELKKKLQRVEASNTRGHLNLQVRSLRSAIVRLDEILKRTHYQANPLGFNQDEEERAEELVLFTENTGELYPQYTSIVSKLKQVIESGANPIDPAVRLLFKWFTEGAKLYVKEVSIGTKNWQSYFTDNVRMIAAKDYAETTLSRIRHGDFGPLNVKRLNPIPGSGPVVLVDDKTHKPIARARNRKEGQRLSIKRAQLTGQGTYVLTPHTEQARKMIANLNPMKKPCCDDCSKGLPCAKKPLMNPTDIGKRIELSPHMDLWMRGARYGTVKKESNDVLTIKMDHPGVKKLIRVNKKNVKFIENPIGFAENPLSSGETIALLLGGLVAVGGILYFALKPAVATTTSSQSNALTVSNGNTTAAPTTWNLATGLKPGQTFRASADVIDAFASILPGCTIYTPPKDALPQTWPQADLSSNETVTNTTRFRINATSTAAVTLPTVAQWNAAMAALVTANKLTAAQATVLNNAYNDLRVFTPASAGSLSKFVKLSWTAVTPGSTIPAGQQLCASIDLRSDLNSLGMALWDQYDNLPSDWPTTDNGANRWRVQGVWNGDTISQSDLAALTALPIGNTMLMWVQT
jgi:hypothetical protein